MDTTTPAASARPSSRTKGSGDRARAAKPAALAAVAASRIRRRPGYAAWIGMSLPTPSITGRNASIPSDSGVPHRPNAPMTTAVAAGPRTSGVSRPRIRLFPGRWATRKAKVTAASATSPRRGSSRRTSAPSALTRTGAPVTVTFVRCAAGPGGACSTSKTRRASACTARTSVSVPDWSRPSRGRTYTAAWRSSGTIHRSCGLVRPSASRNTVRLNVGFDTDGRPRGSPAATSDP